MPGCLSWSLRIFTWSTRSREGGGVVQFSPWTLLAAFRLRRWKVVRNGRCDDVRIPMSTRCTTLLLMIALAVFPIACGGPQAPDEVIRRRDSLLLEKGVELEVLAEIPQGRRVLTRR